MLKAVWKLRVVSRFAITSLRSSFLEERILIGTAMPDATHMMRPAAEQNLGEVKRWGGLPRSDRIASGMPDVGRCL